jgi:3-dehydroquinate synthase
MVAHLHKRGARLVQVPTTLLSAVDASLGGKGAVNVRGVKNALGVFHDADEGWICSELFTTLSPVQRREGWLEAWKMVVALDARLFFAWQRSPPTEATMIQKARALKAAVCAVDPRERTGARAVLNFGHTFGHVLESLSKFRLSHGDAVGLGMLCALDVGWRLGVTPADVKARVEAALPLMPRARAELGKLLAGHSWRELEALLSADKKGAYSMVLLERPGQWTRATVPVEVLKEAVASWSQRRRG